MTGQSDFNRGFEKERQTIADLLFRKHSGSPYLLAAAGITSICLVVGNGGIRTNIYLLCALGRFSHYSPIREHSKHEDVGC